MIDYNQPLNQVGYCNWSHGSELRHLLGSSGFSAEPEGNELMLTMCIAHNHPCGVATCHTLNVSRKCRTQNRIRDFNLKLKISSAKLDFKN